MAASGKGGGGIESENYKKKFVKEWKMLLTKPVACCIMTKSIGDKADTMDLWLGVAQFGSVLEWGSRGRRFESSHPDQ